MGDRANVAVVQSAGPVFLYTHWTGSDLPAIVQRALAHKQRWTDDQYLARIVFSEMIRDSVLDETGFGIGTEPSDGEDRIVVVDVAGQQVYYATGKDLVPLYNHKRWTFEEFIALDSPEWRE